MICLASFLHAQASLEWTGAAVPRCSCTVPIPGSEAYAGEFPRERTMTHGLPTMLPWLVPRNVLLEDASSCMGHLSNWWPEKCQVGIYLMKRFFSPFMPVQGDFHSVYGPSLSSDQKEGPAGWWSKGICLHPVGQSRSGDALLHLWKLSVQASLLAGATENLLLLASPSWAS